MTVAPLIAMKSTKCDSLEAVGKELDRRAHTYANDVDQSGRHVGYLCRAGDESPVPLEQAIERRMGELNTKRKIRDNQVRAMGFIVSSNDALDEKDAREFLDRSVQWFGARYGYENLLAAQIHLDEGTPHAHIWIAPVVHDRETGFDRLCAKELFAPDRRRKNAEGKWEVTAQGTMSRLQEDFWEQVAKPYGYERPMRHELRSKGYRSLEAYKVQVGTTRALQGRSNAIWRPWSAITGKTMTEAPKPVLRKPRGLLGRGMRTVTIDRRSGRGVRAASTSPRRNVNHSLRLLVLQKTGI